MIDTMTGRAPVYRARLKDNDGFPTMVVAGRDRHRSWLYVHATTPTVLRLHPPVVRFLHDALTDVAAWFHGPQGQRVALVWTLPWCADYPECVLVASDQRVMLHVFAASPSAVRLNPRVVRFLRSALADLPAADTNQARRAVGEHAMASEAVPRHDAVTAECTGWPARSAGRR